jgi:hypothetical protein
VNVDINVNVANLMKDETISELDDLTVTVYYECLCPDSQAFITNQLYPTCERLGKYFRVEFKPFGKATFVRNSVEGWNFTCQHGPEECTGNMYQACLLKLPENQVDSTQRVQIINCIMSDATPDTATLKCMKRLGVEEEALKAVEGCANSVEGQWALHDLGVETQILQPAPTFIPQINFNGVNKQEWQDGAVDDFEDLLCKRWLISVPECKARNGAQL